MWITLFSSKTPKTIKNPPPSGFSSGFWLTFSDHTMVRSHNHHLVAESSGRSAPSEGQRHWPTLGRCRWTFSAWLRSGSQWKPVVSPPKKCRKNMVIRKNIQRMVKLHVCESAWGTRSNEQGPPRSHFHPENHLVNTKDPILSNCGPCSDFNQFKHHELVDWFLVYHHH